MYYTVEKMYPRFRDSAPGPMTLKFYRIGCYCFLALTGLAAGRLYEHGWQKHAGTVLLFLATLRLLFLLFQRPQRHVPNPGSDCHDQPVGSPQQETEDGEAPQV